MRQRVDELAAGGGGAPSPQAERAARSARQATDRARHGYEMAAEAQDSAARAHDLVADGLVIRAERAGDDDREGLLRRAGGERRTAGGDRAAGTMDRAPAAGLS